ncbi:hypothetical protein J3F84DRAFT_211723 [Trichoderma pleuroticola]|uniref:Uncharacterized protein n=1 Tax=Trichoderma harzianum TaxID=5544 RepID=A0A2K0UJ34_TRIHA|nr:hypothetical protein THARTR1_01915 [Trichoderma harzianum]
MSLSRAFTTRKLKLGSDSGDGKGPHRSHTLRHKISAPVQLVHTTNMLSYNAPDLPKGGPAIPPVPAVPAIPTAPARTNSAKSLDDSDSFATNESTPPTSPDIATGERTPSPKPNHLSGYFKNSTKHAAPVEPEPAPMIPQRSPTHTKKNSVDAVARSRSISRISRDSDLSAASRSLQAFSRTPSVSTHSSAHSSSISNRSLKQPTSPAAPVAPMAFAAPRALKTPTAPTAQAAPTPLPVQPPISAQHHAAKDSNPFGPELGQLTELAEEYSSATQMELADEDLEYIRSKGLVRLRPDDYLSMIQGLSSIFFSEPSHPAPAAAAPLWI